MPKLLSAILVSLAVGFAAASWIDLREPASTGSATPGRDPAAFDQSAPVEERIRLRR